MALIVEDGTGKSDAESFGSLANAILYHTKYGNTTWLARTSGQQESDLRLGTRYMQLKYGTRFIGTRLLPTQALGYPVIGAYTFDGYPVESDSVPVNVQNACFEAALVAGTGEDMMPDVEIDDSGNKTVESITVGPISLSNSFGAGQDSSKSYAKVEAWLRGYVRPGGSVEKG